MALTAEQLELFENNEKQQVLIHTLEISHSLFTNNYFITRDVQDRTFILETGESKLFEARNFAVQTPSFSVKLDSQLQFSVDIVNYSLMQEIENLMENPTSEQIKVIYRVYTDLQAQYPILGPLIFEVDSFNIERHRLMVNAKIHELVNNKFPEDKFTKEKFKGLGYV